MDSPLGAFLSPPGFVAPSGMRAIVRESSVVLEAARLVRRSARDRLRPPPSYVPHRPDHQDPVVLVPGFMAGDSTLALMARHLRGHGFRTYRSTMHANVGCSREAADALERRVESVVIRRGRKVSIVGHSLGGLLARAIAARRPDLVEGIVTMGSPLLAPGAVHPVLALDIAMVVTLRRLGLAAMMGADCTSGDCARTSWEQARAPLRPDVAFTSIFSRRDGVVDWRSCLDPDARRTVEVTTSHLGMAFDPVVQDLVLGALRDQQGSRSSDGTVSSPAKLREAPRASAG